MALYLGTGFPSITHVARGRSLNFQLSTIMSKMFFPERKRQHQNVQVPAAQLRGDLAAEQLRIAPRHHDPVALLVVQRPKDPAPGRQVLYLVEKKKAGVPAGQLVERGQEAVHVLRRESLQTVILKIHEQEVVAMGLAGTDQRVRRVQHEAGLARAARPDDGRDEGVRNEIQGDVAGYEVGRGGTLQPFSRDSPQNIVFQSVYHSKQFTVLLFTWQAIIFKTHFVSPVPRNT